MFFVEYKTKKLFTMVKYICLYQQLSLIAGTLGMERRGIAEISQSILGKTEDRYKFLSPKAKRTILKKANETVKTADLREEKKEKTAAEIIYTELRGVPDGHEKVIIQEDGPQNFKPHTCNRRNVCWPWC